MIHDQLRFLLGTALLCLLAPVLSAQVGLSAFVNFNDATLSEANGPYVEHPADYGSATELAINYWFRLPKQRIEFQPTAYYVRHQDADRLQEYGLQLKTNIYVFDLATDCDCPTFGKQGPQLDKGFFVQVAPGVARHRVETPDGLNRGATTTASLGAGVGIDFGLSNLLTITPLAGLRYHLSDFDGIEFPGPDGAATDNRGRLVTYQLGVQATFRLDKRRY